MQEEDLKRLENKLDTLLTKIDEISKKLDHAIVIPKYGHKLEAPQTKSKTEAREEFKKYIERRVHLQLFHGRQLRKQFNLVMPPSVERIEQYLRTNDPKAFDGLKRNK